MLRADRHAGLRARQLGQHPNALVGGYVALLQNSTD